MIGTVTAGLIFAGSPAFAINVKDAKDCEQTSDAPRQITGCTRLLKAGNLKPSIMAVVYNNRCLAYGNDGDHDRAIADCSEAIRIEPKYKFAFNNRGLAWKNKGEPDRAIADFNAALSIDAKYSSPYGNRASAWREKRDFDRAFADYDEAIRISPKLPIVYNNRALLWRDLGDYDRALADDNESIRLNPQHAKAYSNRGEIWRLKGDLDRAISDQDIALKLDKKDSTIYVLRGDTFRYKGDFNKALNDYEAALRLDPRDISAFTGRGLTFEKIGDYDQARANFVNAVTSKSQNRSDINRSSLETAQVRLAALDSGAIQPTIGPAPAKVTSPTTIPTSNAVLQIASPKISSKQGRRVALVIGNSRYRAVGALTNPENDASAIASSLRNIGFDNVTLTNDATREALIDALRSFANEAESSDWAMVYYAGHGIEVSGINYLIPVDAKLAVDRDIEFEAVPLNQVLRAANSAKKIKLIMLDACRDNPFKPRKTETPDMIAENGSTTGGRIASRSTNGRGLAEVKVAGATLVVFAAKDGQVALDGEGSNSPFAVAVVQRLATPGVEINKLFRLVRDDVMEATAGRQEPYTYGSLPGKEDFFFVTK